MAVLFATTVSRPVNTVAPAISGTPEVGETLTCSQGTYTGEVLSRSYVWKNNGTPISNEIESTLDTTGLQTGDIITAQEVTFNAAGLVTTNATGTIVLDDASGDLVIEATLERFDGGSGELAISNGVIFAEGDVTEADVTNRLIRVYVDDVEQAVYTEALDGRWPDGSVKSVLIQFANTFSGTVDAEIRVGTERGTTDISSQSLQASPDGLLYLDSPTYLCNAFPLWFDILPQASHPTSPDAFGVELDAAHAEYVSTGDEIWTRANSTDTTAVGWLETLTTRTSDTAGVLTKANSVVYVGDEITLVWSGGTRTAVVSDVTGGVTFSGGSGDVLPAESTTNIRLTNATSRWYAIAGSALYEFGQHSYVYYCQTGDADYMRRAIIHGSDNSAGYLGQLNWNVTAVEWYAHWQASQLLHYWLTGWEDSRTSFKQYLDFVPIEHSTTWWGPDGNGHYAYGGRTVGSIIKALAISIHLGLPDTDGIGGASEPYETNLLKLQHYVDIWIAQQETGGERFHAELSYAVFTLSGVSGGPFQEDEYISVNGGSAFQNQLMVIDGTNYTIKRNSGGVLADVGDTVAGNVSGASATVATRGTLVAGSQPWMNCLANQSLIAYSRFISSDRDTEIFDCIEKDYNHLDQFWNASDNYWPLYDTNANGSVLRASTGDRDLNSFVMGCLDYLIENEADAPTKAAYISRGESAVAGIVDSVTWADVYPKQFNEKFFGFFQFIHRREQ